MFKNLFGNSHDSSVHFLSGFVQFVHSRGKGAALELLNWCLNLSSVGQFICLVILADVIWILLCFVARFNWRLGLQNVLTIVRHRLAVYSYKGAHPDPVANPLSIGTSTGSVITFTQDQVNLFLGLGTSSFTLMPGPGSPRVAHVTVSSKLRIQRLAC